ncbi:MAG: nicotinate-nucleotide adenylyltransferase [Alphaproteobacteria bacterium]
MIPGVRPLRRPVVRQQLAPPPAGAPDAAPRPLRVGLLGGSFNPAHGGHRRISIEALKRLELDQIWWLVAPQNPLKPKGDTAPLAKRLERARLVAAHPRIRVSDLEARLGTRYTVDTVARIRARFAAMRFVWLMGADNLATLHRWRRWRRLVDMVPIAIFDRDPYSYIALASVAAHRLESARWTANDVSGLVTAAPPAWCLLRLRTHPAASSAIRADGRWCPERMTEED